MTRWKSLYLYVCALLVAFTCVAYELLLGSYATYLMGASIFQYSLTLSLMMLSMGVGSLVARPISINDFETFFLVEIGLAWCAMLAIPLMYLSFALNFAPMAVLIVFVTLLGLGIGMEIPLLSQMNPTPHSLVKTLFSDYAGGFIGGLAFPLILLPHFGFFQLGGYLALLNALVACFFFITFKQHMPKRQRIKTVLISLTIAICALEVCLAESIRLAMEESFFGISEKESAALGIPRQRF